MGKFVTFCLSLSAASVIFASELKLPQPLTGDQYNKTFKEYYEKDNGDFNAHNFEADFKIHEKYCFMGLSDACVTLGQSYALGFGVEQDVKQAIKLVEYGIKNTPYDIFKTYYSYSLEFIKELDGKDQDLAIRHIIRSYSKKSSECQSRDTKDKDACFKAIGLSSMLPQDMLGITDSSGIFEMHYDNDIAINGNENSKTSKMIKAYESILR